MGERSSSVCMSIALGMALVAASGCVRLDEGHCIVNGGDFACDEGWKCATELDAVVDASDEGDGCLSIERIDYDFERYFVHVKYGLPEVLGSSNETEDPDSVAGVLDLALDERELRDDCEIDGALMQLEPCWREVKAVRTFLERPTRVRVESAKLESFQVVAITAFNDRIDTWLDECGKVTECE